MKKALSLFLAFIMTFGVVAVGITEMPHSHAEETASVSFTENGFVYEIVNGESVIVDYTDKQSTDEIIIPVALGGYSVTELAAKSFIGCRAVAITIPASVTYIDAEAFAYDMPNIERYTVDENNTKYSSENGILYRGTGAKTIVAYPKNAPEESLSLSAISVDPFAFTEVRNLKNVTLSYGYVNSKYTSYSIYKYAFYNAASLESVEMGETINSLGDYAFASCPSLVSVKIYDLVESLGWDIFADTPFINNPENYSAAGTLNLHKNLIATHPFGDKEYYEIPAGIESVAGGVFQWNSLKEVYINEGVDYIVSNPFAKCPNLKTFIVDSDGKFKVDSRGVLYCGSKVIAYPNGRNESCYNFADISPAKIIPYAFYLSPVKNFFVPSYVTSIGYCALGGEGVLEIHYESDETDLKKACYNKKTYETTVSAEEIATIHYKKFSTAEHYLITDNAVQSVCNCGYTVEHSYADGNCTEDGFIYEIMCQKAFITGYKFRDSASGLVIPETVDGYPVTKLERGAFRDCMSSSVQIPASVTEIDPEAFAYAPDIQSFTVASGNKNFTAIDGVLFRNGTVLALVAYPQSAPASEYEMPAGAVEILPYAFYGSKNLKTIDSWQSVIVNDYAFYNSGIETISNCDLQHIGNGAFKNSCLKEFSITSTPVFFGYNAFEGTPFLENAVYDDDGVFYHENILISVDEEQDKEYYEVKDGTTVIAGGAIKWKSLEKIGIPASIETVNGSSFSEAISLKTFALNSNNQHFKLLYDSVLFSSDDTKIIAYPPACENVCFAVPQCVTEIGAFAFNNIQKLGCVHIPSSVKTVNEFAFGMNGFRQISSIKTERAVINWRDINFVQSGSDMVSSELIIPKTYGSYTGGYHSNVKSEAMVFGTGCDEVTGIRYTCSCGYIDFLSSAPKAHISEEEYTFVKYPTCNSTGTEGLYCSVCSKTLVTRTVSALGHDYELAEHVKATCTENGEKTYKCTRCKTEKTEEAEAALSHISSGETVKIEPTCTEDGGVYYLCIRCNEPIYDEWIEIYPATDVHNYQSEVTVRKCTSLRIRHKCVDCDYYYYDTIKVDDDSIMGDNEYGLGHIVEDVVYEPTCTENGESFKECVNCGCIVGDITITSEALGHTWEEEIYYDATCTEEGELLRWCTVCEDYEFEVIPMIPHTFEKWDYEGGNTFSGVCTDCGESFEKVEVQLTLDRTELTLYNQSEKTLSYNVTDNISDNIVFNSSDSNVASVDSNGVITANAPGNAVVTARIAGTEIMAQCEIIVKARTFKVEWIVDGATYDYAYVEEGAELEAPEDPEKTGCVFSAWSPEVPETMPSNSLTFTAVFVIVSKSDDFDVSATYLTGCFDEDVTLEVSLIEGEREPGGIYMVDGEYYKQIGLYNIKTVNGNNEVIQPNEGYKVTVKLAVPEEYKEQTSFMIYHRFTDGGREQLSTENGTLKVEDGYLVFEVSRFSEFEIFVKSEKTGSANDKVTPSIKIASLPAKIVYAYGEDIDLTGISILYTNSNGEQSFVTNAKLLSVSGYDSKEVGTQIITVKYGNCTETFEVKVRFTFWQWIIRIFTFGLYMF